MLHTLRRYEKRDMKEVRDLIISILAQEYPVDKSAYSESDLDKIDTVYGGEREIFIVIEVGGHIVGTVGVKEDSKTDALVRRLFVDSRYRGKGFGSMLVKEAVEFARGHGYKKLIFRCTDKMKEAMNLCLSKGFKEYERLPMGGFNIHMLALDISK